MVEQELHQAFLEHLLLMLAVVAVAQFLPHHLHLVVLVEAVEARQIQMELLEQQTLVAAVAAQTLLMTVQFSMAALVVLVSS